MPRTDVLFYRNDAGVAPVLVWLQGLRLANERAFESCAARLRLLAHWATSYVDPRWTTFETASTNCERGGGA